MLSLWRGNTPYVLRHIPSITLSFAFKDLLISALPRYHPHQEFAKFMATNILAGGISGFAVLGIVYPFDYANIRLSAHLGGSQQQGWERPHGTLEVWRSALRQGGPLAVYRGFGAASASVIAYKSLYFGLYDTAKGKLGDDHSVGLFRKFALASATVYTASTLTYPLDVIKKRLVADMGHNQQYQGFADCVRKIAQREGIRGFFRFYTVDVALKFGGGFLLVLYDEVKRLQSLKQVQQ